MREYRFSSKYLEKCFFWDFLGFAIGEGGENGEVWSVGVEKQTVDKFLSREQPFF